MTIFERFSKFLINALLFIIWLLPKFLQKLLALIIYFLIAYVIRYRKKVIINNMQNAFPNKSTKEIKKIARRYYLHLSYMILEIVNLRFSSRKNIAKCLEVANPELLQSLRKANKNVLIILGHYGNWEFGSAKVHDFDYRGIAIYKKLNSKAFEYFYQELRQNLGVEPVEMHRTLRKLIEVRNEQKPYILLSVADQTPIRSNIHHWLNFLNQDTGVFMGPEILAKKFDLAVVYCEIKRCNYCKFLATFKLITDTPTQTAEHEIIEKFFAMLEESIVNKPEDWVWSHRRWKHKR